MSGLIEGLIVRMTPPEGRPDLTARVPSDDELAALLEAARAAPSGDNQQIWRFVVVRAAETRGRLAEVVSDEWAAAVSQAPVVIVVCGLHALISRARREQPFVFLDVPIAVTHMLLQAAELDLPCAWTLEVDEARCRRLLGIPESVRVVALLALG